MNAMRLFLLLALAIAGARCSSQEPAPQPSPSPAQPAAATAPTPASPAATPTPTGQAAASQPDDDDGPPAYESGLPDEMRSLIHKPFTGDFDEMVKRRLIRVGAPFNWRTRAHVLRGI